MSKLRWRPKLNPLTTPRSYRAQPVPKESSGYDKIAERIALKNPVWNAGMIKAILLAEREAIKEELISGNQVSLENAFTFHISLAARLDAQDDPLPTDKTIVNVQVYAARAFVEEVRQAIQLERLPPVQKLPVLANALDTMLGLDDVLDSSGVLRLSGTNLLFDLKKGNGECVIEGTREGRAVQTRFAMISNSLILVLPVAPSQTQPWNNEYRVSVSTRYTEHGSLRTGTYQRLLRTPLAVQLGSEAGILSGAANDPLVRVTGGQLTAEGARVRVQAVLDAQDGDLRLSLLDMSEDGVVGNVIVVSGNGSYTLPGYAGSELANLEVTVLDYEALVIKVREEYTGRMVDILDVGGGT